MSQHFHGIPLIAQRSIVSLLVIGLSGLANIPPVRADPPASPGEKAPVVESVEHLPEGKLWQRWPEDARQRFKHQLAVREYVWWLSVGSSMSKLDDVVAMYELEACLDSGLLRTPRVYLNLAIAHLMFGRFDSAIAVLERGQQEARPDAQFAPVFRSLLEDARRVKAALTKARDALRAKGQEVSYPEERIFPVALAAAAAEKDTFLVLNLADAWVSAFPKSPMALRCVADQNLAFAEQASDDARPRGGPADAAFYRGGETNVPPVRVQLVFHRGQAALKRLNALDGANPYPTMRITQFVLWGVTRHPEAAKAFHHQMPGLMRDAVTGLDQNPNLAEEQKAFILYVESIYYLTMPTWENRELGNEILRWLEDARRRDPETKLYADALGWWRVNNARVTQEKLIAGRIEAVESRRRTREAFGLPEPKTPLADTPAGRLYHGLIRAAWNHMIDELKKEEPVGAELFNLIGCPACWGSGKNAFSGKPCDTCGGDGRTDR